MLGYIVNGALKAVVFAISSQIYLSTFLAALCNCILSFRNPVCIYNSYNIDHILQELAHATVQDIDKEVDTFHIAETKKDIMPLLSDPHLNAEVVFTGIEFPTIMAFLTQNDILVLEKNEGIQKMVRY